MHVRFYMHENLAAAGNIYKRISYNIQYLNTADIFQLSILHLKFSMHISIDYLDSKFFIVIIYSFHGFSIVPPDKVHIQQMFFFK